eukprot:SAG22_NODE_1831_length_3478_cov_1.539805_4_plen_165_part_00
MCSQPEFLCTDVPLCVLMRSLSVCLPVSLSPPPPSRSQVPTGVHEWVKTSPGGALIMLEMAQALRVQRLVEDYCSEDALKTDNWVDDLRQCIAAKKGGLAKKLGGECRLWMAAAPRRVAAWASDRCRAGQCLWRWPFLISRRCCTPCVRFLAAAAAAAAAQGNG